MQELKLYWTDGGSVADMIPGRLTYKSNFTPGRNSKLPSASFDGTWR